MLVMNLIPLSRCIPRACHCQDLCDPPQRCQPLPRADRSSLSPMRRPEMNRRESGSWAMVLALGMLGFGATAGAETKKPAGDKIGITTSSEEARQAYLKGRDLNEKL